MIPTPAKIRFLAAFTVFVVLTGALYWASRRPTDVSRPTLAPQPPQFWARGGGGRASIEGIVLDGDGRPTRADVNLLTPIDARPMRGGPNRGRRAAGIRTGDDGRFSLNFVPVGHYLLVAHAAGNDEGSDGANFWAAAEVEVNNQAHATSRLKLKRSGGLSGQIVVHAIGTTATPDLTDTSVSLEPVDADAKAALLDGLPQVAASSDGRFFMADLPPGRYRLTATVRVPWMVDAIVANGRDSLAEPVTVVPGTYVGEAVITVTNVPCRLEGEARDPSGRPAPFALVFAFASDPSARQSDRRTQAVRADASGRFSFTGLPSGDYLVGIAIRADPSTWYTPGFLTTVAREATHVHLMPGSREKTVVGGRLPS